MRSSDEDRAQSATARRAQELPDCVSFIARADDGALTTIFARFATRAGHTPPVCPATGASVPALLTIDGAPLQPTAAGGYYCADRGVTFHAIDPAFTWPALRATAQRRMRRRA